MTATKEITSASVIKALDERKSLKAQIEEMNAKIEEMNAKIKELEASIENEIGQGTFHCNGYSITCLDKDTTRFDTTRFKAEQPEVYAEYCKTSTVHSFTVRELTK